MNRCQPYSPLIPQNSAKFLRANTRRYARHVEVPLCWDEQNRLLGVADKKHLSLYQYDADGERTYKLTGELTHQNVSGNWSSCYQLDNATLYASPYLVATSKGYTKHYYAENERVASRIGGGGLEMISVSIVEPDTFLAKTKTNVQHAKAVAQCLTDKEYAVHSLMEGLYEWKDIIQAESDCYWYHSDHLGSSSWITYSDGKAVQHLHYMPWGEDFVRQRSTDWHAMYTFSAKEKDTETGYSYFGSRYYNSDLSIWLSVDPMSDKYPSLSPYVYCADNPIKLVDPNGEYPIKFRSGVMMLYSKTSIGAGVGFSASGSYFSGRAFDKSGVTRFAAISSNYITNQNLKEGSSNLSFFAGAGVGISGNAAFFRRAKSFKDAVNKSFLSIGGGDGLGANFGFGEGVASVGLGLDFGGGLDYGKMNVTKSISSLSYGEADRINDMSDVVSPSWTVGDITPKKKK